MENANESAICSDFIIDFTDEETATRVSFQPWEIFLSTVGVPLVLIIGVPGNAAFLFTLYRVRHMRTATNFYLANLAVADLMYLITFSAYNTETYLSTPIAYSSFAESWVVCLVIALSLDIPYFASNAMITLVALERFYAICHPLKNLITRSHKRSVSVVVIFWALSILIAASISSRIITHRVACVLWPDDEDHSSLPDTVNFCVAGAPWVKFLTQSLYFGFWFLGLSTNTFLYYKIVRRLGQRGIPTSSAGQAHHLHAKEVRQQIARMLIVTSIVYFLLQSPRVVIFNLMGLLQSASRVSVIQPAAVTTLWPIAIFLALLNSALNPIIYNVTNPKYRQSFLKAFTCCRKKSQENVSSNSNTRKTDVSRSFSNIGPEENQL